MKTVFLILMTLCLNAYADTSMTRKMTDPTILTEVINTNKSEIALAQLANEKATIPEVKKYAQEMLRKHQKDNQEATALIKEQKIEPSINFSTESHVIEREKDMAFLKIKKGKDFDRAYLDNEIKAHKNSLKELNERLIPKASNEELKAMLNKNAKEIKGHLEEAEKIQRDLL